MHIAEHLSDALLAARFSPNGRWVAYQSDETGAPEVYVLAPRAGLLRRR